MTFSTLATAAPATEDLLDRGWALTHAALFYAGTAVAVYLILLFVGRTLKRRFKIQLGWSYHLFAFSAALFLPSLIPHEQSHWLTVLNMNIDAAVILTTSFVAISLLRHYFFEIAGQQPSQNAKVPKFLSQVVSIIIFLIASMIVLNVIYQQPVTALLASAGVAALVLGLALQDTLSNIFSGFAIFFGGQFKPGDWLQVDKDDAEIMEFNWRSTRLRTTDNVYLDIPNSNITKQTVINFSHPTHLHAMRIEVGLDYEAPPTKVRRVLTEAALMAPYVLKQPAPVIYLKDFASSSVTYQIKFWMDDHSKLNETTSTIRTNLWYGLRRNNIGIPYPVQMEGHFQIPSRDTDHQEIIKEALSKVSFREFLADAQIAQLTDHAHVVHFGMNEILIHQGDQGDSMYVITQGSAEVLVEAGGTSRVVATLESGDCVGEMSLLTGENRSATVKALTDTVAVEINKTTLAPIIAARPELLESLSDMLARRRLQNEGLLAQSSSGEAAEKRQNYRANFLGKLRSFFEM